VRRAVRWTLIGAGIAAVLVVAALAAVPYLVDTPRVQALVASSVSQALGRRVAFAGVSVAVLPLPAVVLRDLQVAEDPAFGPGPFLTIDRAEVRLRLWPLLLLRVELGDFVLKKPAISLVQRADGRWNISSLGAAPEPRAGGRARPGGGGGGAAGALLGSRVRIADGQVTYERRARGAAARYRVEGLDFTLTGAVGGGLAFRGDGTVRPGDLAVRISEGTVGPAAGRALHDAPVRARVTLDAKNVHDLVAPVAGAEPVVAGGLRGSLAVSGTVGDPVVSGEVALTDASVTRTNPECPAPKRRTLTLGTVRMTAGWEGARVTGRPLAAAIGGGAVTANLTATLDGGIRVELDDLAVRALPLETVLVDFLCQGYAVTGPLDLTGRASARLGDVWRTLGGQGQLRIGPGRIVGARALALLGGVVRLGGAVSSLLSADLPPSLFASPLEFDSITGTYRVTDGVVTTRDLLYTSRAMKVAVAGSYTLATGALDLDVVVDHGRGQVKARVTGTTASPSIRVAPATILRDLEPGKVERSLRDLLKQFR